MNDAVRDVPGTAAPRSWRTVAVASVAGILLTIALFAATGHAPAARWSLILLGGVLSVSSGIPNIRAARQDPAGMQPLTWGIWTILTALAAAGSATAGDWASVVFSIIGAAVCATLTIVVLRGGDHRFTLLHGICLTMSIAGVVAWQALDQPRLAVIAACVGDLAALTPMIVEVWCRPNRSLTAGFTLIAAGGLCTAAAAWGDWTMTALAYPVYVAVSTGTVAVLAGRQPGSAALTVSGEPTSSGLR